MLDHDPKRGREESTGHGAAICTSSPSSHDPPTVNPIGLSGHPDHPPAMVTREPSVGFRPVCCASGPLPSHMNLP